MDEISAEGCLAVLERAGLRDEVMRSLLGAIQGSLSRRAGDIRIGALLFEKNGFLGMTEEAEKIVEGWRNG
jgi:hypothetical protein